MQRLTLRQVVLEAVADRPEQKVVGAVLVAAQVATEAGFKVHPLADAQPATVAAAVEHAASIAVQAVPHTHPLVATQVAEVVNVVQAAAAAHEAAAL